ncbi:stress-activated map kinase-interacting protein 1 isoform X1 [Dendroctonus ponderosae]|uniref:Target of rapamycin complex 2 subunit MAPKAP1 n=1 Tax=Dendroctonus ponderosae TaxID=77166 RepID=A0AAR5Q889_DENPD|nr:stress-activated map kinase-interacting protein 1 isoform X1 [Dendroctonus ponderosae]
MSFTHTELSCNVNTNLFSKAAVVVNKQNHPEAKMALYDNKYWLLSHIRNSFISTDDTGMCELVMVGEAKQVRENFFSKESFPDPDESDEEDEDDAGSYDIQMDGDYTMRERSMTAARLEKLEYYSRKAAKMKHIKWESRKNVQDEPDGVEPLDELFVKKDTAKTQPECKIQKKSALSALIEQSSNIPVNPYTGYARFDGAGQINLPTKKYRIYLTMLPEQQRNYPLNICCVAAAKVLDLIGLILLKFSTNYAGDYVLKPAPHYGLYITEEDGEVDSDFPNLDPQECVSKFGFTSLGLVEHEKPCQPITVDSPVQVTSLLDGCKKRTTSSSRAEETKQVQNDMMIMDGHNKAMEAPLYKSYTVFIVNKVWWWNIEVHLGKDRCLFLHFVIVLITGISSEKIEIDPITQKNSKLKLGKQGPVSHPMDSIAWCEETDGRGNKRTFRVVYSNSFGTGSTERTNLYSNSFGLSSPLQSSPSFKHYDFEAERNIAEEIVQKINLILELRSGQSRREYLALKDKKHLSKRKQFKYLRS